MQSLTFGLLVSGHLGAICLESISRTHKINFVFTDKGSLSVIDLCERNQLPLFIGNPRNGRSKAFISSLEADVLLSINYLFIIDEDLISLPKKAAINFHGSLLPKYRGRTPHVWAIINNEKETGITAHLISSVCDEGDIIYQEKIAIACDATGASILKEFNDRYPVIVTKVIKMIESGPLTKNPQDNSKATYFGKRTPEDGRIKWGWQKEQIRNWVRAQAKPYPGAFTYFNQKKITIHAVEFNDHGFQHDNPDGMILNGEQMIVKTPNGAVRITDVEMQENLILKTGEILDAGY